MSTTKELIEFLDDMIAREKRVHEHKCRKNLRIAMFKEIQQRLEQQAQPDEELVEEVNLIDELIKEKEEAIRQCGYFAEKYISPIQEMFKFEENVRILKSIRFFLQFRQPEVLNELAKIIKLLYTSEKIQLTQSDITKFVNRLEVIENILQSRQPVVTRDKYDCLYSKYVTLKNSFITHICPDCGVRVHIPVAKGVEVREK